MTLNPIAAIEKLINEHGSAAILRERLSLASDQYSALEGKVTELQTKTEQLEAQNEELRCRVEQNVAENQRLRNQLNENTAHGSKLSPDELNVLQAVAREPGHNHCGIAKASESPTKLPSFSFRRFVDADSSRGVGSPLIVTSGIPLRRGAGFSLHELCSNEPATSDQAVQRPPCLVRLGSDGIP